MIKYTLKTLAKRRTRHIAALYTLATVGGRSLGHTESRIIKNVSALAFFWGTLAATHSAYAESVLYRYKNDRGVSEMNYSIPAEYAQKGYEILNKSGQVIKVVPPAPSASELEEVEARRETLEKYEILRRRYSDIDDIERAKQRKLKNLKTNIAILEGTISNLRHEIEAHIARAAEFERSGRTIPETILGQLTDARSELKVSEDLLESRNQEYKDVSRKYDEDKLDFIKGETLAKKVSGGAN